LIGWWLLGLKGSLAAWLAGVSPGSFAAKPRRTAAELALCRSVARGRVTSGGCLTLQQPVGLRNRRLQIDRSGLFFAVFLPNISFNRILREQLRFLQ
jgi:hypothetical protein